MEVPACTWHPEPPSCLEPWDPEECARPGRLCCRGGRLLGTDFPPSMVMVGGAPNLGCPLAPGAECLWVLGGK